MTSDVQPLRLHIGGEQPKPGWLIVNIVPGPHVDHLGSCTDLSAFADGSVEEVYASHVLEHLSHNHELTRALKEIARVLRPGGVFRLSVPDFELLIRLYLTPEIPPDPKFILMRYIFGGQEDEYDHHKVGLTFDLMLDYLEHAGFSAARRVTSFDLFDDSSHFRFENIPISLNMEAYR